MKNGPQFYDTHEVLQYYINHRASGIAPNENIEQPVLWDLIDDPTNLSVLDLGCGDARISKHFEKLKSKEYVGIDGSKLMVEQAQKNLVTNFSEVQQVALEEWNPTPQRFDLVISSLTFHYLEDLETVFTKVRQTLKSKGRFIFSVEHPVITSSNVSLANSPIRGAWIVDNYFVRGKRTVEWMGDTVTKYHRTFTDYLDLIAETGFSLTQVKESDPQMQNFEDVALWERRRRIPLFLFVSASKID